MILFYHQSRRSRSDQQHLCGVLTSKAIITRLETTSDIPVSSRTVAVNPSNEKRNRKHRCRGVRISFAPTKGNQGIQSTHPRICFVAPDESLERKRMQSP